MHSSQLTSEAGPGSLGKATVDQAGKSRSVGGQAGLAHAVVWPVLGLALAAAILTGVAVWEAPPERDSYSRRVVKNGQTAWFGPPQATQASSRPATPAEADVQQTRLHIVGWFVGTHSERSGSNEKASSYYWHAIDLVIDSPDTSSPGSGFEELFYFKRLWELSFYGTGLAELPLDETGRLPQIRGLKKLLRSKEAHIGERRMDVQEACRAIFGGQPAHPLSQQSQVAFWNISSLSGKAMRIVGDAEHSVTAIRPVHGELFAGEADWLRTGFSRDAFRRLYDLSPSGEVTTDDLLAVLPSDAGLQTCLRECTFDRVTIRREPGTQQIEIRGTVQPTLAAQLPPGALLTDVLLTVNAR